MAVALALETQLLAMQVVQEVQEALVFILAVVVVLVVMEMLLMADHQAVVAVVF